MASEWAEQMKVKSLAYKTDLIFHRFEGNVLDRGSYLVIETSANPGFFWGNLLLFSSPPSSKDYPEWKSIFQREFSHNPLVKHFTFAWDGVDGEIDEVAPFEKEGFAVEKSVVMTAVKVSVPTKYNSRITVQPLARDEEWDAAIENQIACRSAGFDPVPYRVFKQNQMARYRRMSEAGLGHWFGAYLGDQLIGDLGIYRDGSLARFQSVGTHPDFRRQGICGALVHQASEYAFQEMGIETLVMVADPDDHPARIYTAVGFQPTERTAGMYWWDKK